MKSIKPGRFNSAQGALGSVFGVVFAIFWTVMAWRMGAPFFFPLFGVFFIIMSLTELYKNLHNATQKDRYSEYDITDSHEELDPWDERVKRNDNSQPRINEYIRTDNTDLYCPYCGSEIGSDFEFCPKCGRKLPF